MPRGKQMKVIVVSDEAAKVAPFLREAAHCYYGGEHEVLLEALAEALESAQPGVWLTPAQVKTARSGLMLLLVDVCPSKEIAEAIADLINTLAAQEAPSEAQLPETFELNVRVAREVVAALETYGRLPDVVVSEGWRMSDTIETLLYDLNGFLRRFPYMDAGPPEIIEQEAPSEAQGGGER